MSKIHTLRPGIYSSYDVVSDFKKINQGCVLYCGRSYTLDSTAIPAGQLIKITSIQQLQSFFKPLNSNTFYRTCKVLLENGVQSVYAIPLTTDASKPSKEQYFAGLKKLSEIKTSGVIFCDSDDITVLAELVRLTQLASSQQKERIAIAYAPSANQAISMAESFNSERLVICCQGMGIRGVDVVYDVMLSVSSIAAIIANATPSKSFNSQTIAGVNMVSSVSEETLEELLAAGVSVLEANNDSIEIVRLVTTRTSSSGQPDRTFASVNTVLMIDHIIKKVRSRLQSILKTFNGNLSLDAISSQTAIILEESRQEGLLVDFEPPVVFKDNEDPQVCTVEMEFTLASIPSQIFITAHVSL